LRGAAVLRLASAGSTPAGPLANLGSDKRGGATTPGTRRRFERHMGGNRATKGGRRQPKRDRQVGAASATPTRIARTARQGEGAALF